MNARQPMTFLSNAFNTMRKKSTRLPLIAVTAGVLVLVAALVLVVGPTAAQGSPMHPTFPLLDANGENVLDTGLPVSTIETCGACHDAAFITEHNAHAGVLTGALSAPAGESVMINPDTSVLTPLDEAAEAVEMNCFLCHSTTPDNTARLKALEGGQYEWANTATLLQTGIVEAADGGYTWNAAAFADDGTLLPEYVQIQDPAVGNCAQCHGVATTDAITPLVLDTCGTEQRMTITTGQIFAPQRISESGLNVMDKDELDRSWDVHAERIVGCTDCHYSLNNPAYASRPTDSNPEHLVYDPRRLDPGEYLSMPVHEFARSSDDTANPENGCISCHDAESTHDWLPYADKHMESLACETCHVPRLEAPARETVDWTVLTLAGMPDTVCRGQVEDNGHTLITGYDPVLLPREEADGSSVIAPYNLITTSYWVDGASGQPVALTDLQAAFFDGDAYQPDVLAAFDADGSGTLDNAELAIDSEAKQAAVAARLEAVGVSDPQIEAKVDAYPINHGVTHSEYATRECSTCHDESSRLAQPIELSGGLPGGIVPTAGDNLPSGDITTGPTGVLFYQPQTGQPGSGVYAFGFSRVSVIDWIGVIFFLVVLVGVTAHGGLRYVSARRRAAHAPELQEVYMYTVYERFWHWLQTAVILLLLVTGLIIHKPEMFGMFAFRGVVLVHNVLAVVLVANAVLALFYHLASGEIRQFLPEPHGFFNDAIVQAKFYLRGIFEGAEHPFEKTPERKMNPLQQITYLGILNVLLPAQIITGALMWGAQRWPAVANALGGLPVLAPIHSLVAWLFASFIVAHVYLTTTGHEPMASIRGMVLGWDEVEAPSVSK